MVAGIVRPRRAGRSGTTRPLRAGDVVEVRPAEEIIATLEQGATVDGLPFQPEMLAHCGSRFTVTSRADTTCFYGSLLHMDDTVHLTGVRCDGSAHNGCEAGCLLFWKEEWLRPVQEVDDDGTRIAAAAPAQRRGATLADVERAVHPPGAAAGDEQLWSCQATQVRAASRRIPHWDLRHYIVDVRNRNVRARTVLRYLLPSLLNTYQGISRTKFPRWLRLWGGASIPFVHGRLTKTPRIELGLEAGDQVRVKSRPDIRETLDTTGRNRGLTFDTEMVPYCGQARRVERIVTKLIDDWTGRFMHLPGRCVVLDDVVCTGRYHGLCQRQLQPYWREAWLQRD